jgi:hypothetical protein
VEGAIEAGAGATGGPKYIAGSEHPNNKIQCRPIPNVADADSYPRFLSNANRRLVEEYEQRDHGEGTIAVRLLGEEIGRAHV